MDETISGMRPDPRVREPHLTQLAEICADVARTKKGTMVFLAGEPGSGRSATLAALAEMLRRSPAPRPVVIAGTFASGKYAPLVSDRRPFEQSVGLLGEILALPALFTNPQFFPVVGLVAQLLQAGAVTASFVRGSLKADPGGNSDPGLLLKCHLREAASHRPVAILLDDIDSAEARFVNTFFQTTSGELFRDRPLSIVAALDAPEIKLVEDAALAYAPFVANSLVRRGLARWMHLYPMTREEITAWLGRAQPSLISRLHSVTGGNPEWLALLWNDLWKREAVQPHPDTNRWEAAPGYELASLGIVEDILGERLQALVDTTDPDALNTTLFLLAIAALEGPTFTAAPLAKVLDWEEDELIDFLDEALIRSPDQPLGILEEADAVTIPGVEQDRCLWRYRFVSRLFWRTFEGYSFAGYERPQLCQELAESLESAYGSEVRIVARTLGRLFAECGEAPKATHYRALDNSVDAAQNLYYEAQLLMTASTSDWQPIDHVRAAKRLIEAAAGTYCVYPFLATLHISEAAYASAIRGGVLSQQATAKHIQATAHHHLGDPVLALQLYEEALLIQRRVGNRAGEAATLHNMALVYAETGEPMRALKIFEEVLPIVRQVGDRAGEAATLHNMAGVYLETGESARALALYEEALPIRRQVGNRAGEAATLLGMAGVYAETDEPARALQLLEQALPIQRQVGNRIGEPATMHNMARLYADTGEQMRALQLLKQALPIWREVGDRVGEAATLSSIARAYAETGEPARALQLFEQALPIQRQVGDRAGEARTIGRLGVMAAAIGMPVAGLKLVILGTTLLTSIHSVDGEGLTAHLARLADELEHDPPQIETLRAEVLIAYARDKGDGLIREAFPPRPS